MPFTWVLRVDMLEISTETTQVELAVSLKQIDAGTKESINDRIRKSKEAVLPPLKLIGNNGPRLRKLLAQRIQNSH